MLFAAVNNGMANGCAPAWGATEIFQCVFTDSVFQSTLPRGERHVHLAAQMRIINISIHAPAWGATAKEAKVKENRLFIFV